jgi:apolipoprotein N-acyltransferase
MFTILFQNQFARFLAAIFSGFLLGLAWHKPFTAFIFIGFVPFLLAEYNLFEQNEAQKTRKGWLLAMVFFLAWNFTASGWLYYVGWFAFLFAVICNSLLMSLPYLCFHFFRRKVGKKWSYVALPIFWLAFEWLHTTDWAFSWTWLNLGNAFGFTPTWVQWYEYTGVFGGSAWVLAVNILLFYALLPYFRLAGQQKLREQTKTNGQSKNYMLATVATLFVPFILSAIILNNYTEQGKPVEVVVVQPNFDTYTEKFDYNARTGETNTSTYINFEQQFNRCIELTKSKATPQTTLVLLPETAIHDDRQTPINENIEEVAASTHPYVKKMIDFKKDYPQLSFLAGTDSYTFYYDTETQPTPTARYHSPRIFYDVFNAALFLDTNHQPSFYHKSRLVVGVESNPLRGALFGFLQKTVMANVGNLVGDLGFQAERQVFQAAAGIKAAPVICYESIYGEFVTDYVKKGANLLCILTNDCWWDDSAAPRQHFSFASLRAIETRRAVARSANTGISGFINQKGEVIMQSVYGETISLRGVLKLNEKLTFYVRFGDIIAKFCLFLAIMLYFIAVFRK